MTWVDELPKIIPYGGSGNRPSPIPHAAIAPPFDPNDSYGNVHTTLPPEQVIPPHFTDPLWMRADVFGCNLDANRWGGLQRFKDTFLIGANTTPYTMLMTPMVIMYPKDIQDACLTEHAERGYDDFVIANDGWNMSANHFTPTPQNILSWAKYLKSWGFRVVLWQPDRPPMEPSDFLKTLLDAGAVDFYINGKEVNSFMTSEDFELSIQNHDRYINGRIPIGAHFTADANRKMGYPQSAPPYVLNWSLYNGRLHLMQQLDVSASAGLQGASMYYGRKRVMGQGDGAQGPGAPDSRVIAFETMATAQLYGKCTEEYGCLRDWELICGTRDDMHIPPVSGFANGCRYPDGRPI